MWDLHAESDEQVLVHHLEGHAGAVISADIHPTLPLAVTACTDTTVRLWNYETGEQLQVFNGHEAAVPMARFNPDGTRIMSAAHDNTVRIWDLGGNELATIKIDESIVVAEWSPDGKRIAVTNLEGNVQILSATPWSEISHYGDADASVADRMQRWRAATGE